MSGKNKLVPRLLGVTKDSIVRVDERTKDVRRIVLFLFAHLFFSFFSVLGSLATDTRQTMDRIGKYIYFSTTQSIEIKI